MPYPRGHKARYIERYNAHTQEVRIYFKEWLGDLLVMDITRGDGWDVLCPSGLHVSCRGFSVYRREAGAKVLAPVALHTDARCIN